MIAVKRARREADTECDEMLAQSRHAHELDARALYWWRLTHPDETEPFPK